MGCLSRDYDAVTQASTSLTMNSQHMRRLERFTVLMYSKNCESESVNEARKMMFTHGLKSLKNIPPTQHALFQHATAHCRIYMETISVQKSGNP
jgi:hypothetical protein